MEIEVQKNRKKQAEEFLKLALANRAQITLREKDLTSAESQLRRSESQLRLANESMADTVIRAPISGTILEKTVEEGQIIFSNFGGGGSAIGSSEGTTLVTMADLSKVYVVTEVDETDIGKVRIGQPVTIAVEAYPDQPFEGEVLKIAPQGQVVQNVTTFEVTTELKNTRTPGSGRWGGGEGGWRRGRGDGGFSGRGGGRRPRGELDDFFAGEGGGIQAAQQPAEVETRPFLKPGMNATVEISAASKQDALLIENEAIISRGNRKMVRVIGEDGQPGRPTPITTGISSFDKTEIISGLEDGQVVAIGGGFGRGGPGGRGNRGEQWRQRMQNPASTFRRMERSAGGGRGARR